MNAPNTNTGTSAMTFPCLFPIKAMGLSGEDLNTLVVTLIRKHAPDLKESAIESRPSRHGKYTSVTVTIEATSQAQLDAIYRELTACERIIMAL